MNGEPRLTKLDGAHTLNLQEISLETEPLSFKFLTEDGKELDAVISAAVRSDEVPVLSLSLNGQSAIEILPKLLINGRTPEVYVENIGYVTAIWMPNQTFYLKVKAAPSNVGNEHNTTPIAA